MMAGNQFPTGMTDLNLDSRRRDPDNMLNPYDGQSDFSEHAEYSPGYKRFGDRQSALKKRYGNAYARAFGSPRLSLFG